MSIGQGYTQVTTLQLANAVAMVANAGTIYRPHLMSQVRDSVTGEILEENQREVLLESDMTSATFRQVQEAMRGVITDGTARSVLFTDAVTVAGKTGTGEVAGLEEQWHSWFVAYGPYEPEDPRDQVVVAVMVDAVNDWEWWAPKAANIIFHGIFTDQSYEETVNDFPYWVQSSWGLLPEEPTAESEPAGEEDV
jgi:penicillin-binding protein 2